MMKSNTALPQRNEYAHQVMAGLRELATEIRSNKLFEECLTILEIFSLRCTSDTRFLSRMVRVKAVLGAVLYRLKMELLEVPVAEYKVRETFEITLWEGTVR